MIEFTQDFREEMVRRLEKYSHADSLGTVKGKISVITEKGSNLFSKSKVIGKELSWNSDESGPSPLAYFLSGMTTCQSVHFAEHAASSGMIIKELEIEANGEFTISRPRRFTTIDFMVRINSGEDRDALIDLAKKAISDCYVTNTLKAACEVKGRISINNGESTEIP